MSPPSWRGIVAKRFSPEGFDAYVRTLGPPPTWVRFCVLHNTSSPTLAQRPHGLTMQHILNLQAYYKGLGWSAGPHLFVDQLGIWVFTPLKAMGVHSPSWNDCSWGVEMVGEFDVEAFDEGPGAAVRDNAVAALATLHEWAHLDSSSLRFHRSDPKTTHRDCPGKNVIWDDVVKRVHDRILEKQEVPGAD